MVVLFMAAVATMATTTSTAIVAFGIHVYGYHCCACDSHGYVFGCKRHKTSVSFRVTQILIMATRLLNISNKGFCCSNA